MRTKKKEKKKKKRKKKKKKGKKAEDFETVVYARWARDVQRTFGAVFRFK